MKYLCLVYLNKDKWSAVPDRECANCGDSLPAERLPAGRGTAASG